MWMHLLAQPAGVDIGGGGEEQHPEQAFQVQLEAEQVGHQRPHRSEVKPMKVIAVTRLTPSHSACLAVLRRAWRRSPDPGRA